MSDQDSGPGTALLPPSGLAEDFVGLNLEASTPERFYSFADSVNATAPAVEQPKTLETWVTFWLAGETFALPVTHVYEILRVTGVTRVPHAPAMVRGVTNMRGRVLPVIDLRVRLGLSSAEPTPQSRILVVTSRGRSLGLLVDAVQQVERIQRETVQPPPPDVMTTQSDYIIGVCDLGARLVILLDVDRILILREIERDALQGAPQGA
ncbi:MAG TPA: chemotaxis protein CheW [Thermoanaerobaculia bacterium]|nr:chemotaxis protein CheW [Thermoanaerobaculia bacterium]